MMISKRTKLFSCAAVLMMCSAASAQDEAPQMLTAPAADAAVMQEGELQAELASEPEESITEEAAEAEPGDIADLLNSQQQLKQTFTLRRTINGEVVETEKRTVTYTPGAPYRETEAGGTTLERLKSSFDGQVLTRIEAFEEAKLDFTIADANRDGAMTAEEFAALVESWDDSEDRLVDTEEKELTKQEEYEAFLAEIDPESAKEKQTSAAIEKFAFLTGGGETVTREVYIREYLLDFDTMDADKDTILRDEELLRFRALNRGEELGM